MSFWSVWFILGIIGVALAYFLSVQVKKDPKKYFTSVKSNRMSDILLSIVVILLGPIMLILILVLLAIYYQLEE